MIFVDGREIRVAPVSRNSLLCDCRGFREFRDTQRQRRYLSI